MTSGDSARGLPEPYWFSAFPFPPGHFRVHAVDGREALGKPYVFDVTVTASSLLGDGLERLSVGHRAALALRVEATTRVVSGVVESARSEGLRESERVSQTRFRVVPMLALLRHQRGSRILQEMRVDQVVDQVLGAAGVGTRWTLTRPQPIRPYITQCEGSDLTFVRRILAESGLGLFAKEVEFAFRATENTRVAIDPDVALVVSRLGLPPMGSLDSYNYPDYVAKLRGILASPDITALTPTMDSARIEKEASETSDQFFVHNWFAADFFHEVTSEMPPKLG